MTQPIQEPSTQRSVSGLAWGEAQLARRPGPPAGSNDLPWGKRYTINGQTIADSTMTPLRFLQTGTTYAAVSDTADIEIYDFSSGGYDFYGFDLHRQGFWRLRLVVSWDDNPGYGYVNISPDINERIGYISSRGLPAGSPITFDAIVTGTGGWFPLFYHSSGADRDTFVVIFTALYLGSGAGAGASGFPF